MNKNFVSLALVFFGICFVFGSFYISEALTKIAYNLQSDTISYTENPNDWELIVVNERDLILFNSENGQYWIKDIEKNGASIDWEKGILPEF